MNFGPSRKADRAAIMRTQTSSTDRIDQMSSGVPTGSAPSSARRGPRPARPHSSRPRVLDEELFRDVLVKERKRADRSNRSVVLLLVGVNDGLGANSPSTWAPVIGALSNVARETDVLGWFEWQTVIGVILPECPSFGAAEAQTLEARVARQLASRSDGETAGGFSIRLHVHPEPKRAGDEARLPVGAVGFPQPQSRQGRATIDDAIKRTLDAIGSAMLLLILSPLFLLIAAVAKLKSRGPVFFRQVRIGQGLKPFTMIKFRTMHVDVDHKLHQEYVTQLINSNAPACGPDKLFKLTDDPRVTPVGRFLRKTSLDELPQLWNVLRGDMSLVGPRPPLGYELEQYKPWHYRRVLEAKPGMTGLWQVAGRSRTSFDQMVRLDLRYARTCSVWADIKILLATPKAVISGKGAC